MSTLQRRSPASTGAENPTRRVVTIALCLLVIALVVAFGFVIVAHPEWTAAEYALLGRISSAHTPFGDAVALGMSWLFSPIIGSLLVLVVAGAMAAITHRVQAAVRLLLLIVIPWLGSDLMKFVVHRPRPDVSLLTDPLVGEPTSFSYPSGHTVFATACCLALLITFWGSRWRPVLVGVAIIVPLLMAACRVYLGVHYPSDVVAGLVYAGAAVVLVNTAGDGLLWSRKSAL